MSNSSQYSMILDDHPLDANLGDSDDDGISEENGKGMQRSCAGNGNREIKRRREGDGIMMSDSQAGNTLA